MRNWLLPSMRSSGFGLSPVSVRLQLLPALSSPVFPLSSHPYWDLFQPLGVDSHLLSGPPPHPAPVSALQPGRPFQYTHPSSSLWLSGGPSFSVILLFPARPQGRRPLARGPHFGPAFSLCLCWSCMECLATLSPVKSYSSLKTGPNCEASPSQEELAPPSSVGSRALSGCITALPTVP